jgi:hypothetical protein
MLDSDERSNLLIGAAMTAEKSFMTLPPGGGLRKCDKKFQILKSNKNQKPK